jgi:peroxiredoxin
MARRRRKPTTPLPSPQHGEHTAQRAQSLERRLRRPSKTHAAKRERAVTEGPRRRTRGEPHHPCAELDLGIGEIDGLAEIDEVMFVAGRTGARSGALALAPEVDPQRELALSNALLSTPLPALELEWMPGEWLDIQTLGSKPLVLYCHPGAEPDALALESELRLSSEDADETTGADAAQCREFGEHSLQFASMDHRVVGVSSQSARAQLALAIQEALPHIVLSDDRLELAQEMGLPTYEADGACLYERLTLIVRNGRVEKVFYPVPDPATHAAEVAEWLREGQA